MSKDRKIIEVETYIRGREDLLKNSVLYYKMNLLGFRIDILLMIENA